MSAWLLALEELGWNGMLLSDGMPLDEGIQFADAELPGRVWIVLNPPQSALVDHVPQFVRMQANVGCGLLQSHDVRMLPWQRQFRGAGRGEK